VNPESVAKIFLAGYAAIAAAAVVWQCLRSGLSWGAWALYAVERLYLPLMFHWRANRRCPFPDEGPALIVANHRTPVDPLFLWMNNHLSSPRRRIRIIRFLMVRAYEDVPGIGWITRNVQTIGVERDGRDLKGAREALDALKQGELVGIFPEGRLNEGEGLLPGDTGVAWLALRSEVPVFPVFIHDAPQGKTMVDPFWTPSSVRVTYGEPVDLSAYYGQRKSQELLREVTDLLMQRLAELGGVIVAEPETIPLEPQRATG
jgi:1-acyl-sn-glycerol-3-phosphate acyltransferase